MQQEQRKDCALLARPEDDRGVVAKSFQRPEQVEAKHAHLDAVWRSFGVLSAAPRTVALVNPIRR